MRRTTDWGRYLRRTAMNVSRNVQDLFGTPEATIYTHPDPTPRREAGPPASDLAHPGGARPAGKANRLSPRERRGRD
jgi:hypothetical protein